MTPSIELALFAIATLFGCILSLACLPWRTNSMNIGSVLLSSWLLVGCFTLLVNFLAMNTAVWCDISTKLIIGVYIGVPASMVCVLHHLYMTVSSPNSLPNKRFYQLFCKLALMLGMPALIIVVHIVVQDRRYIFIEQAGCIPSISPSLFPLVAVLIWPLLFDVASLVYLGLIIHLTWVPRQKQGAPPTTSDTMTLWYFLRLAISLFIGIVCTGTLSLFLLVWITNNSKISVGSLHHDFQTVYIVTADQWSHNPQLRAAIELRWLWVTLSFVLTTGMFPRERIEWLVRWFMSAKIYARTRTWHQSTLNTVYHGSLPVYISRASGSSYGEVPVIPALVRQSTLAPTFNSGGSSVQPYQPEALTHTPELGIRSKLSQLSNAIRPNEPSEPRETPQRNELPRRSWSPHQTEPLLNPKASMSTLASNTSPTPSLQGAPSYRTCEEESVRR